MTPEHHQHLTQAVQAIQGLAEACLAFLDAALQEQACALVRATAHRLEAAARAGATDGVPLSPPTGEG